LRWLQLQVAPVAPLQVTPAALFAGRFTQNSARCRPPLQVAPVALFANRRWSRRPESRTLPAAVAGRCISLCWSPFEGHAAKNRALFQSPLQVTPAALFAGRFTQNSARCRPPLQVSPVALFANRRRSRRPKLHTLPAAVCRSRHSASRCLQVALQVAPVAQFACSLLRPKSCMLSGELVHVTEYQL
jgi:hypothetical protein